SGRLADDEQDFGTAALALAAHDIVSGLEVHRRGVEDGNRLPASAAVGLHRRHWDCGGLEGPGVRSDLMHGCVGDGHVRAPSLVTRSVRKGPGPFGPSSYVLWLSEARAAPNRRLRGCRSWSSSRPRPRRWSV